MKKSFVEVSNQIFQVEVWQKIPKKKKITDHTWVSITWVSITCPSATQMYLSMILHMPECRKLWNPLTYIEISRPRSTLGAQRYQGLRSLEIWGPSRTFWIPFFGETHGQNASHKKKWKKIRGQGRLRTTQHQSESALEFHDGFFHGQQPHCSLPASRFPWNFRPAKMTLFLWLC